MAAAVLAEAANHHSHGYCLAIRRVFCAQVRDTDAATLEAQLLRIDQFELPVKGSAVFAAKKLFSEFEISYFEAGLARFGEMGFPMKYKQIQAIMNTALRKADRKDILWRPLDVSIDYVRKFIRERPLLTMLKASNIDPLRSRKATPVVSFICALRHRFHVTQKWLRKL